MSTTSLVGGGLIAGDALAALGLGIAGLLGVMANRLARVIDRARNIEEKLDQLDGEAAARAQVLLASLRQGSKTYRSQIVVRADSGITTIEQLRGKKFAFVDPASASGFLFPNALLASMGIDYKTFFSDTIFAGGHDKSIIAVYNKQVDGGASFGQNVDSGPPTDARTLVTTTLPDVMTVVKPIGVNCVA